MDDVTVCLMLMDMIEVLDEEGLKNLDACLDKQSNFYRHLETRMLGRKLTLSRHSAGDLEEFAERAFRDGLTPVVVGRIQARTTTQEVAGLGPLSMPTFIKMRAQLKPLGFWARIRKLFFGR